MPTPTYRASRSPLPPPHQPDGRKPSYVLGVGIDLVELHEFERSVLRRPSVLRLVFSEQELAQAGNGRKRVERLAARFAAKEAAFKAAGTGWVEGMTWQDVEVVSRRNGKPELVVRGELRRRLRAQRARPFVSLSHSGTYATAIVVLAR